MEYMSSETSRQQSCGLKDNGYSGQVIIGITGPSASGKSLIAHTIVSELESDQLVIITEDSYYKDQANIPLEQRKMVNYDHPNAFDHALLYEHLKKLRQGKSIEVPVYNYEQYTRTDQTRTIGRHTIIILEGIMLFADSKLRELLDIRIFIDTPLDICLIRRLKRDVIERKRSFESVLKQYQATVRPMYFQFIEPSKRYADIIVPRGGENRIAIDMIKAKVQNLLEP